MPFDGQDKERAIIDAAFRQERKVSAQIGFRVRTAGIVIIALTLALRVSGASLAYYLSFLAVLALTGWLFYRTTTRKADLGRFVIPIQAVLVAIDMALITAALVAPGPGAPEAWPDAIQLRLGNVSFLFVFLALSALTYSPGLALWAGLAAGTFWLCGVIWVLIQPGSFTFSPADFASMEIDAILTVLLDPNYVSVISAVQEAVLLAIVGAVIAAAVWRGRKQAIRQIETARERAKLSRYFSPDVANELTSRSIGVNDKETRRAAIIFADIFSFTKLAEQMSPEETIDFLREFHRRATAATFREGGTLNKFIGDEVMISFGAINTVDNAAAASLRCAVAISAAISEWSDERVARGEPAVRVGVGLHIGDVVVGNIGDERCLELALLGDVVNVASRLQKLTRDFNACIVCSSEALDAARAEKAGELADEFEITEDVDLRGRRASVEVGLLRNPLHAHVDSTPG